MKIEIKLDDPTKCDDCPCRQASPYGGTSDCGQYYDIGKNEERPQECIDKHGE